MRGKYHLNVTSKIPVCSMKSSITLWADEAIVYHQYMLFFDHCGHSVTLYFRFIKIHLVFNRSEFFIYTNCMSVVKCKQKCQRSLRRHNVCTI